MFYFYISLDLSLNNFIKYLISRNGENKMLLALILFSSLITLSCYIILFIIRNEKKNIDTEKNTNYYLESQIENYIENKTILCKLKMNKSSYIKILALVLTFIIIFMFILLNMANMGHDNAKNKKEFWIISDYNNRDEMYVELYGENDKILFAPYIIASNSVIIDNRSIIIKQSTNIKLSKNKFDAVELVLKSNGAINKDYLTEFDKVNN